MVNAGDLITVAKDHFGGTREEAYGEAIGDRLLETIERADARDRTVLAAAEAYAEERTEAAESHATAVPEP